MTARPTHIDIATLRAQVNAMLDLFEQQNVLTVPLDCDFYWSVPWGGEYEMATAPVLSVGSLADDIDFLAASGDAPVAPTLCHAAPLLHYLGQRAGDKGVF